MANQTPILSEQTTQDLSNALTYQVVTGYNFLQGLVIQNAASDYELLEFLDQNCSARGTRNKNEAVQILNILGSYCDYPGLDDKALPIVFKIIRDQADDFENFDLGKMHYDFNSNPVLLQAVETLKLFGEKVSPHLSSFLQTLGSQKITPYLHLVFNMGGEFVPLILRAVNSAFSQLPSFDIGGLILGRADITPHIIELLPEAADPAQQNKDFALFEVCSEALCQAGEKGVEAVIPYTKSTILEVRRHAFRALSQAKQSERAANTIFDCIDELQITFSGPKILAADRISIANDLSDLMHDVNALASLSGFKTGAAVEASPEVQDIIIRRGLSAILNTVAALPALQTEGSWSNSYVYSKIPQTIARVLLIDSSGASISRVGQKFHGLNDLQKELLLKGFTSAIRHIQEIINSEKNEPAEKLLIDGQEYKTIDYSQKAKNSLRSVYQNLLNCFTTIGLESAGWSSSLHVEILNMMGETPEMAIWWEETLLTSLDNQNESIRIASLNACAKLPLVSRAAQGKLKEHLNKNPLLSDTEASALITAMENFGHAASVFVPEVLEIMKFKSDPSVRLAAQTALIKLDPQSIELRKALQTSRSSSAGL